jgi:hypothetical protein
MLWMRLSVLLLMVSVIGLSNGCGNGRRRNSTTVNATSSEAPDGVYWEGQTDENSPPGSRSVTTKKQRGNHPFDQVAPGETYESIVARFGPPSRQSMTYTWSTMAGKFSVEFDPQQNAQSLSTSAETSPEREREIRDLVDKQVSFTTMTAHLGNSPTIDSGRAVWNRQDGHALYATFGAGKVLNAAHGGIMPTPWP